MIKTAQSDVAGPLSKAEAQTLTERIRNAVDSLGALVEQAHDRRAWKAMGYATWEAYVSAEFGFTRQRSYQLLDQGRVAKALGETAGTLSTDVVISEAAARDIKPLLPEVAAKVEQRVAAGEEPKAAVAEAVKEKRQEKAEAKREAAKLKTEEKPKPELTTKETASTLYNGLSAEDRIAELEQANAALEKENAELRASIKQDEELELMRRDWREGGWEQVVRKEQELRAEMKRASEANLERVSRDRAEYMRSAKAGWSKAREHGYSRDEVIDLSEAGHG